MRALNVNAAIIALGILQTRLHPFTKVHACVVVSAVLLPSSYTHNIRHLMLKSMASTLCVIYRRTFSPPRIWWIGWEGSHLLSHSKPPSHCFLHAVTINWALELPSFKKDVSEVCTVLLKSYDVSALWWEQIKSHYLL